MKPLFAAIAVLFGVAVVFCGGCERNPYDKKVSAETLEDLSQWISINTHKLSMDEINEINTCVREIRISFMMSQAAKGRENLDQMLCKKVNGMPLKEVLVTGYELQIQRIETEKARYLADLNHKEKLKTRAGDVASAHFLKEQKEMVREQINKFAEQINRCSVRLDELRKKFNMPDAEEETAPPERI